MSATIRRYAHSTLLYVRAAIGMRAGLALLAAVFAASVPVRAQEIWLAPHAPGPFPGVADWNDIFTPGAPWQTAASHVKILILADGSYDRFSDAEIVRIADFLAQHGGKLGVGINALTKVPGAGCGGMEGYSFPSMIEALAARLSRLHVQVGYVEADGPLWFGHFATDAQACQLPIAQVAQSAAPSLRNFLKYYPDAIYGDVEGSVLTGQPGWQQAFSEYRTLLEKEIGHKIDALDVDVAWPLPSWPYQVAQVSQYAHANGLRLGLIYNADGSDGTDAAWMDKAERHFERIEGEMGIIPDEALIASWNDNPARFLPETSPTAFSHLVLSYMRPLTRFALDQTHGVIRGRIVDRNGQGVAGARVVLQSVGLADGQAPPEAKISGMVPEQAKTAVFALGINVRPDLAGANDIVLGDFLYAESGSAAAKETISVPDKVAADRNPHPSGIESAALLRVGDRPLVRLVVRSDQGYHYNSPHFAVDGGAAFTLTGPIASASALGMFGAIDIVWLDAEGKDRWRSTLHVEPTVEDVAETVSDPTGHFEITAPATMPGGGFRLAYEGSSRLRAAYADIPGHR